MYDNPYINHLQYRQYPDLSQEEIVKGFNNPTPASPPLSEAYLKKTYPDMGYGDIRNYSMPDNFRYTPAATMDEQMKPFVGNNLVEKPIANTNAVSQMDQVSPVAGYNIQKPVAIDPNAPTEKELIQQQQTKTLTGGVNSAISSIPVYGQIIGAATALSSVGRGLLKKDEYGNVKGNFGQGVDEALKPQHEHIIEDATKGKWGDVALDVFLGGQHKTLSKWFST